jgi:hypothetical protein
MENKEQAAEHYAHNNFNMHDLNHYKALEQGFKAGASWQSSQPINSELTQLKAENERLKAEIKQLQKCPDCNGDGIIIEAECCRLGEHQCCNQPNPIQVQCERCQATGLITNP